MYIISNLSLMYHHSFYIYVSDNPNVFIIQIIIINIILYYPIFPYVYLFYVDIYYINI